MRTRPDHLISRAPDIGWGRACIRGTGIAVTVLADRWLAGDTLRALAKDYARPIADVEAAVCYAAWCWRHRQPLNPIEKEEEK